MGRPLNKLDTTYPKDALEKLYKGEPDPRMKERLLAILHMYEGQSAEKISAFIKRSPTIIRAWRSRWNEAGYQGLKPNFKGGPKPKLSVADWDDIAKYIENKGMSLLDVSTYILETYQVEYSYDMVWRELRGKRNIPYGKPFKINDRMPDDATEQLQKK